jgi:hypothetical protein
MPIEPRRYWHRIAGIPVVDPSVQQRADISSHNDSEQWQKINDAAMHHAVSCTRCLLYPPHPSAASSPTACVEYEHAARTDGDYSKDRVFMRGSIC